MSVSLESFIKIRQQQGKLLEAEHQHKAQELATPARSLREAILDIDIAAVYAKAGDYEKAGEVMWKLKNIASENGKGLIDYEKSWDLFRTRVDTCLMNMSYEQIKRGVVSSIKWFMLNIDLLGSSNLSDEDRQQIDFSLPQVQWFAVENVDTAEHIPDTLRLHEAEGGANWPRARIDLHEKGVQRRLVFSTTVHSTFAVYITNPEEGLHYMVIGYTSVRPSEILDPVKEYYMADEAGLGSAFAMGEFTPQEEEEVQRRKAKVPPIFLRLATTAYSWPIARGEGDVQLMPVKIGDTPEQIAAWWKRRQASGTLRISKMEPFFMEEHKMAEIANVSPAKQPAVLTPLSHCEPPQFYKEWTKEQSDAIAKGFAATTRRYCPKEPTWRQLRFGFNLVRLTWVQGGKLDSVKFTIKGGPPGTGKTTTLALAVMFAKTPEIVRYVLLELWKLNNSLCEIDDIENEVARVINTKIVFATPTNSAADTACSAMDEILAHLMNNLKLEHLPFKPVRVCDWIKAKSKPGMVKHHPYAIAAPELLKEVEAELKQIEVQRAAWAEGRKKITAELYRYTRASGDNGGLGMVFESEEYNAAADALNAANPQFPPHPSFAIRQGALTTYQLCLQRLIEDPDSFCDPDSEDPPEEMKDAVKKIPLLNNPAHILCFTAGKLNPYQDELLKNVQDAVFLVDEATMLTTPEVVKIISTASLVVLAGDISQLGPVVMAEKEGTWDIRDPFLARVLTATGWLTRCYRLPDELVDFANSNVYNRTGDGLYAPEGQNIIRGSILHTRQLFAPLLIVDISDGRQDKMYDGSTSKMNIGEATAMMQWIRCLIDVSQSINPEQTYSLLAISGYKDQGTLLREHVLPELQSTVISSARAGSINDMQGAGASFTLLSVTSTHFLGKGKTDEDKAVEAFLDDRRINVAATRSERGLVVFCNTEALKQGGDRNSLLYKLVFKKGVPTISTKSSIQAIEKAFKTSFNTFIEKELRSLVNINPSTAPDLEAGQHLWESHGMPSDSAERMEELRQKQDKLLCEQFQA